VVALLGEARSCFSFILASMTLLAAAFIAARVVAASSWRSASRRHERQYATLAFMTTIYK
jgi:hypothetical protein